MRRNFMQCERQASVSTFFDISCRGIRNKHLKNIARSLQEAMVVVLDDRFRTKLLANSLNKAGRAVENFEDSLQWLWRLILDVSTRRYGIVRDHFHVTIGFHKRTCYH